MLSLPFIFCDIIGLVMQKNHDGHLKKRGLTLLEVLLIIGFLGVIFFPILEMFGRSFLLSSESETASRATSLAEKMMEEEKTISWASISSEAKSPISGYPGFNKEILVNEPNLNLKDLEVRIYYPVGGSELMISLKTLVANF